MCKYELFPHPSEQGIRGYGSTLEEAFEEAAKALESVMVDIDSIELKESRKIKLENLDNDYLLIDWLNELLYYLDVDKLVFKEFKVRIENGKLEALVKGEEFNPDKHGSGTIVKAPTYDELKVEKRDNRWIAQCIVDV